MGFDTFDVANQLGVSHHYWVADGRAQTFSTPWRYVWPAELDLMARIGGMRLRERWTDWRRQPFTSESAKHVSVWEKVPTRMRPAGTARRAPPAQREAEVEGRAVAMVNRVATTADCGERTPVPQCTQCHALYVHGSSFADDRRVAAGLVSTVPDRSRHLMGRKAHSRHGPLLLS